ncbi:superinfection immunity protein [Frankia sp. CiP3]|uniref:superinfection immunity protein n=1 Tax=Frankia sp. CiP3 TaxID=2880971 RepID=UPI001EF6D511|nr:superinfection immunity protein [Frankia sp. CiP3]
MDVAQGGSGAGAAAGVVILLAVVFGIAFYFIPTIIAVVRKRQVASVFVINLFLGWTLVGWVVAIALAVSSGGTPVQVNVNQSAPGGYMPPGGWQDPNAYPPAQQQLPPSDGWQAPQAGWQAQQQQPWASPSADPREQNPPYGGRQ